MHESWIIDRIRAGNAALEASSAFPILIAPGDDMAAVRIAGAPVLLAADQVIEGRHWRRGTPLDLVARKALARNVSDVAAMAGVPVCALATAALAPDCDPRDAADLVDGFRAAGAEFRCPVVGGDVGTHADPGAPMVLSVSIVALPGPGGRIVRRAGARPGDLLCVTGVLGDGWRPDGGGRHLAIAPRVAEALELVAALGDRLHAMIDVSDGLARDAGHLGRESGLAVEISAADLPAARPMPWQRLVGDGEEHELAFAVDGAPPASVAGTSVTVVGRFGAGVAGAVTVLDGAERHDASALGWEHGRESPR